MTEKRYYLHKSIKESKFHDKTCHRFMNLQETEDELNLLYAKYSYLKNENEQLKSDNKEYIKGLDLAKATSQSWASVVRELREENCRLEKKNERLIKKIKRERASTTKQHLKWSDEAEEIINDLRKENEELKEEIKDFQDLLSNKEEVLLKPMLMIDKKIGEGNRNYKEAYTEAKIKNIIDANEYQKEVSFILDNVFYWKGYLKGLKELRDELKNGDDVND